MDRAAFELLDRFQQAAVWTSYVLIAIELIFLPIPSEASVVTLLSRGASGLGRRLAWLAVLCLEIGASSLALIWSLYPGIRGFLLPLGPDPGPALQTASIASILVGSLCTLLAVLQLRSAQRWQGRVIGRPPALSSRGLFSFSRNPIQLGMHLTWVGWALALPSWVMFLALLLYLGHKHRCILLEESHLEQVHGRRYLEYRRQVSRYFPLPGAFRQTSADSRPARESRKRRFRFPGVEDPGRESVRKSNPSGIKGAGAPRRGSGYAGARKTGRPAE